MGIVADADSKEVLAFVNLISSDGRFGTASDIDGKFSIVLPSNVDSLRFSYLGYATKYVSTKMLKGPKTIYLQSLAYDLNEYVVFPGPNPAHRIILNAVRNRDINDPQKLSSYAYTTYDKMVITIDTSEVVVDTSRQINDTIRGLREFFKTKDLFLMETAVEKKYMAPNKSNEKVIATKVSGLKDPMMVFLVSQIQSTSFYAEIIRIANKNYINPISKGSINKYYFQIEDTLYSAPNDTIYTISYRPKRQTNFEGLQGVLNISTNKWAIVNVKASPAKETIGIAVQIQQKYEQIEEHWFPVQLNTNISFDALSVGSGGQQGRLLGIGKSYIKDIQLNPDLVKKAFSHIEIEIDPNASYLKEKQWENYRVDSLSSRDMQTYLFMDSVGKAAEFDKKLKELETILTGRLSWGYFDLLLDRFVGYNSFEGFWFGLGAKTNARFSEKLNLGGYYAYSLKDNKNKLGLNASLLVRKAKEYRIYIAYQSDNIESANVSFYKDETSIFDDLAFQKYFINRMNYTKRKELGFSGRMLKYFQVSEGISQENIESEGAYLFQRPADLVPIGDFKTTELRFQMRFAFKEKYFNNGRMLLSMGTKYPVFWFNYTQGVSYLFKGDFNYTKVDIQLRDSFYTKYLGETKINLKAGYVLGDVPYAKLYAGGGTYSAFTIFAPESFATMRPNEFLSDAYVSLFLRHNFGSLLFKGERFKPEFELLSNFSIGWLKHPEYHQNISFKTLEKGYFESGLLINNLIKLYAFNLGVGAIYRYGPNSYSDFKDNISYKLTLSMPLKANFTKASE